MKFIHRKIILIVLCVAFLITSCQSRDDLCQGYFNQGMSKGIVSGKEQVLDRERGTAREEGLGQGIIEGKALGIEQGKQEVQEASKKILANLRKQNPFKLGKQEGFATGIEEGKQEGLAAGVEQGKQEGFVIGFEEGKKLDPFITAGLKSADGSGKMKGIFFTLNQYVFLFFLLGLISLLSLISLIVIIIAKNNQPKENIIPKIAVTGLSVILWIVGTNSTGIIDITFLAGLNGFIFEAICFSFTVALSSLCLRFLGKNMVVIDCLGVGVLTLLAIQYAYYLINWQLLMNVDALAFGVNFVGATSVGLIFYFFVFAVVRKGMTKI